MTGVQTCALPISFFEKINKGIFLKNKKDADIIIEELKSIQGVFNITQDYGNVKGLLEENIHSASDIVSIGENRFIIEVARKVDIETKEAKIIFAKAIKLVKRD